MRIPTMSPFMRRKVSQRQRQRQVCSAPRTGPTVRGTASFSTARAWDRKIRMEGSTHTTLGMLVTREAPPPCVPTCMIMRWGIPLRSHKPAPPRAPNTSTCIPPFESMHVEPQVTRTAHLKSNSWQAIRSHGLSSMRLQLFLRPRCVLRCCALGRYAAQHMHRDLMRHGLSCRTRKRISAYGSWLHERSRRVHSRQIQEQHLRSGRMRDPHATEPIWVEPGHGTCADIGAAWRGADKTVYGAMALSLLHARAHGCAHARWGSTGPSSMVWTRPSRRITGACSSMASTATILQ